MEQQEFTSLLLHPSSITGKQTAALKEVLDRYPFFQAARAVRLKGLRNENSLHYNKELKLTAAYTIDRGVLFDFITSEEFEQNQIADQIKKQELLDRQLPEVPKKPLEESNFILDQAMKIKLREEEAKKTPSVPSEELKNTLVPKLEKVQENAADAASEDILKLGKPLVFNKTENHSFTEWLKLTQAKPIERAPEHEKQEYKSRKFELIDEFISKSPKINPTQPARKTNLAEEHLTSPEALMTETLARVYLEQKNYKKAIQAYKILILKNPEKSGFFADQIRAIEKIQEQNS